MQKYKTLDEFYKSLDDDKLAQVLEIRKLLLEAEPTLTEHLKWNAPSYVKDNEDRVTFNIMNKQGIVKLVLHMGATRKEDKKAVPVMQDDSGLIEWNSNIRGTISFPSHLDMHELGRPFKEIIKNWLAIS